MPFVLVAVATSAEKRAFCRSIPSRAFAGQPIALRIVQTGIGPKFVRDALGQFDFKQCMGIASIGTAAGLDSALEPGDLLLPTRVLSDDQSLLPVDAKWRGTLEKALTTRMAVHAGDLIHTNELLETAEAKRRLFRTSGAIAADMESRFLAEAARQASAPYIVLRVVMDVAGDELPPGATRWLDARGNLSLGALLAQMLRSPGRIRELRRIGLRFRAANTTLAAAARTAWEVLVRPPAVN